MLFDGVFAIAMTILVLELKVPELDTPRSVPALLTSGARARTTLRPEQTMWKRTGWAACVLASTTLCGACSTSGDCPTEPHDACYDKAQLEAEIQNYRCIADAYAPDAGAATCPDLQGSGCPSAIGVESAPRTDDSGRCCYVTYPQCE